MEVTIRIIQIDNQPEIRFSSLLERDYRRYNLTPQQLLNIAMDALTAFNQIRFGEADAKQRTP